MYPEEMREALTRHDAIISSAVAAQGGKLVLERGEGGSTFSVFETAKSAPNAISANRAINRCARIGALAHRAQTLVLTVTNEQAGGLLDTGIDLLPLGTHRLKDVRQPVYLYPLLHANLQRDSAALRSLSVLLTNQPAQLINFVGRHRECAHVRSLLRYAKLVTFPGAGGCGKTWLAMKAAAELVGVCEHGAWLVELDKLHTGGSWQPDAIRRTADDAQRFGRHNRVAVDGHAELGRAHDVLTHHRRGPTIR